MVRYLIRLGYDHIAGYLRGGVAVWYDAGFKVEHMGLSTVHELKQRLDTREVVLVLDVRTDNEWKEGHIKSALHIYVGQLQSRLNEVPRDHPPSIYRLQHRASCESGSKHLSPRRVSECLLRRPRQYACVECEQVPNNSGVSSVEEVHVVFKSYEHIEIN